MSLTLTPIEGPVVQLDRLASCRHCGRLVLLVPWPFLSEQAREPFLLWNPDCRDWPGIVRLVGDDAMHRQGFGPQNKLHRDTCPHAPERRRPCVPPTKRKRSWWLRLPGRDWWSRRRWW